MEKCKKPGCDDPRAPYVGTGRPSWYCEKHCPKKKAKRERDAARAARQETVASPKHREPHELQHAAAREAHRRAAGRAIERSLRAFRPQLLAVYLDGNLSPARAAELAGVEYETEEELGELAREAASWKGLSEGKPEAIGGVITKALTIGAIRLAATIPATQPAQLMNGLYRLAETLERVQGKAQSVFTALGTVFELADGERWSPEQLLPPEIRAKILDPGYRASSSTEPETRPPASATTPSAPPSTGPIKSS